MEKDINKRFSFKPSPVCFVLFATLVGYIAITLNRNHSVLEISGLVLFVSFFIFFAFQRNKINLLTDELKDLKSKYNVRQNDIEAIKAEFLTVMSHELRTPLNAISGFLQLLQLSIIDPKQKILADEAKAASDNLLKVVNGSLKLSELNFNLENNRILTFETPPLGKNALDNVVDAYDFSEVKVLVVEDNRTNQAVIRQMLERIKCGFELAKNGLEAVEKHARNKFDIILMDIQMPVMDGYKATINIRKNETQTDRRTPIIVLSAYNNEDDILRAFECGVNGFLPKPVDLYTLVEVIRRYQKAKHSEFQSAIQALIQKNEIAPQKAARLVNGFVNDLPEKLKGIENAFVLKDYQTLKLLSHELKGSSANIRMNCLNELASSLHESVNNVNLSGIANSIAQIKFYSSNI